MFLLLRNFLKGRKIIPSNIHGLLQKQMALLPVTHMHQNTGSALPTSGWLNVQFICDLIIKELVLQRIYMRPCLTSYNYRASTAFMQS